MINFHKLVEIAKAMKPSKQWHRCYHVAFILKRNRIVAISENKENTHPRIKNFDYQPHQKRVHAELAVVIKGGQEDYSDCDLAVVRIDNNNNLAYSKPCLGCSHVAKELNFENVWYSRPGGFTSL